MVLALNHLPRLRVSSASSKSIWRKVAPPAHMLPRSSALHPGFEFAGSKRAGSSCLKRLRSSCGAAFQRRSPGLSCSKAQMINATKSRTQPLQLGVSQLGTLFLVPAP